MKNKEARQAEDEEEGIDSRWWCSDPQLQPHSSHNHRRQKNTIILKGNILESDNSQESEQRLASTRYESKEVSRK